ncbi:MAG: hypothetical protein JRF02_06675, partial [Deltaproteobacteria bacterium]|nr:hypothetical protein [Deltaproteobacteria bacterium]
PDLGYEIVDVVTDSGSMGPVPSYNFSNVTADNSITASFSACINPPVVLDWDESYFYTIQEGYDYASIGLGLTNFTLRIMFGISAENLFFDQGVSVFLDGGYDCSFTNKVPIRPTTSSYNMTISAGKVTPSNIVLSTAPCDSSDVTLCTNNGDCTAAGGYWSVDTCISVVISAGGRVWMDRNLSASQVATSYDDPAAYGYLYQWGRAADGHQFPEGGELTFTTSSSDTPGHGDFILTETSPFDWRVPQNNNLWQGVNGTNNPCPAGFRLPTEAEWQTEVASWSSMDPAGAFASPLKLVLGGFHCHYCGEFYEEGYIGYYWSSTVYHTVDGNYSHYLQLGPSSAGTDYNHRAYGYSIRCIQD